MTYEELLKKINDEIDNGIGLMAVATLGEGLKAVVELHKPFSIKDEILCEECCANVYLTAYPCETIQAIEKGMDS